jgi:cytoskeletal protein RodZ
VAGNGPSDDFNNQQTTKAAYGADGALPDALSDPSETPEHQSETLEHEHQGFHPAPWYRSPPLLIAWLLLVLILIALIVYGIGELIGGNEGTTPAPSSTTTTTTEPTSTTTTPTTTPPASTTTETTPPSSSEVPPPTQQQPTYQPTYPTTTKHHIHLPPGIKLPF